MQNKRANMTNIKDINDAPGIQNTQRSYHFGSDSPASADSTLQLTSVLQSTLELKKLLEIFGAELHKEVAQDGMEYANRRENIQFSFGHTTRHRCSYRLVLLDNDIGELTLYRQQRFDEEQTRIIENAIAALVYPLRNAILYKQAVERALRDPLTGVNNRAALDNALGREIELAKRHDTPLAVLMIDVDNFKRINDTYGHIAGDAVLKRIAESMVESARGSDIIYRYGGEEFVLLLRNTEQSGARLLAERIRKAIESIILRYEKFDIRVTASMGLTTVLQTDNIDSLLKRCDEALYTAKQEGRNRVVLA